MKPASTAMFVRWLPAVGWTLFITYLMLSPGANSVADDVSTAFGGTDWSDAVGHVGLTFIESLLLTTALRIYFPVRRALAFAAGFTLLLGISLEIAQLWIPFRGATLFDVAANALGVGLFVAVTLWMETRVHHSASRV